jgi:hypothetical protein
MWNTNDCTVDVLWITGAKRSQIPFMFRVTIRPIHGTLTVPSGLIVNL